MYALYYRQKLWLTEMDGFNIRSLKVLLLIKNDFIEIFHHHHPISLRYYYYVEREQLLTQDVVIHCNLMRTFAEEGKKDASGTKKITEWMISHFDMDDRIYQTSSYYFLKLKTFEIWNSDIARILENKSKHKR